MPESDPEQLARPATVPATVPAAASRAATPNDAATSALLVLWFPVGIIGLPLLGGLLGIGQATFPFNVVCWALLATFYFGPFVLGVRMAWRAVAASLGAGWTALGLIGLLGNVAIIVMSVAYIAGKFTGTH